MKELVLWAKKYALTHKKQIGTAGACAALAILIAAGGVMAGKREQTKGFLRTAPAAVAAEAAESAAAEDITAEARPEVVEPEIAAESPLTDTHAEELLPVGGVVNSFEGDEVLAEQANALGLEIFLVSDLYEEYGNLAIAKVDHYVNVRSGPNTDAEIVGRMYDGSVAEVLSSSEEADGEWLQVISGAVEGYIKAEYFIYGMDALRVIEEYTRHYATITATRLNVREEPSQDSDRIGYLNANEQVTVLEDQGDWILVQYTDSKQGYISAEYATLSEEYIYARSMEEIRAEIAAQEAKKAREAAARQAAEEAAENTTIAVAAPDLSNETTTELRQSIIDYAMQYLGNKYVHGGQSLATGTDCSGFTCYVYKEFGYSLSRTPSGQYKSNGRSISVDEAQPGDIICYGNSSCTHVGLYIGGGQILHAANSRKGVIISDINYMKNILGAKNVID